MPRPFNREQPEQKLWGDKKTDEFITLIRGLKAKFTYDEVSKWSGISVPTLIRWCYGRVKPSKVHITAALANLKDAGIVR